MNLYEAYIKERLGDFYYENEEGFATYRYLDDGKTLYIVDLYVRPECRRTRAGTAITDAIVAIGKKAGATALLGTVSPQANNATNSLKALLSYGMTLHTVNEQVIVFRKDI